MTNVKLFDVFRFYGEFLKKNYPEAQPRRMDVTQKLNEGDLASMYAHLIWACEEGKKFVEERRFDKAMRWLGFIQGVLFARGHFSIDELGNHSRPPEWPLATEYVSEALHSLDLQKKALDAEAKTLRSGCSHKNNDGKALLQERQAGYLGKLCPICERVVDA